MTVFINSQGNETFTGGPGYDQIDYEGDLLDYTFTQNEDGTVTVYHPNFGTDTLDGIDGFWFSGEEEWYSLEDAITLTNIYDIAGDASTTATIAIGDTFTSEILGEGDSDWIAFTVESGQTINFLSAGFFADEISIVDADGNILAQPAINDRGGLRFRPDFHFQAEDAGTYFFTVTGIRNPFSPSLDFGEGEYTLTATEITDDFNNFASGAFELNSDGDAINGSLEYLTDSDTFAISLVEGDALNLTFSRSVIRSSVTITNADGEVFGTGQRIQNNFDMTSGLVDEINFTVMEAGEYIVTITNDFNQNIDFRAPVESWTGEYELLATVTNSYAVNEITGTDNSDILFGTEGDDEIFGLGSNDMLSGFAGDDILNGGAGDDQLVGAQGHDTLFGGAGDDFLFGVDGEDSLFGEAGNDTLFGGEGDDFIDGGEGADIFITGGISGGNDYLVGGAGADTFRLLDVEEGVISHDTIADFDTSIDIIDVSALANVSSFDDLTIVPNIAGSVSIYISETNSVTLSNLSHPSELNAHNFIFDNQTNLINGTVGNDVLTGTDGNDVIFGFTGDDFINGGNGSDILGSGEFGGNDFFVGGNGADTFVFTDLAEGERSHNTIGDFEDGIDLIDLSDISSVSSFEDLFITVNHDGNVAIYLSEDQSIVFDDLTDPALLDAFDFLF